MLLFLAVLFIYVAGAIKAFMMLSGAMFHKKEHLVDVTKMSKGLGRWAYDFETEWMMVNAERAELYFRAIILSFLSWGAVVALMVSGDDKYPPQLTLPPMPDKKEFKAMVDKMSAEYSPKPRGRRVKL
jgi:hypothetical protein